MPQFFGVFVNFPAGATDEEFLQVLPDGVNPIAFNYNKGRNNGILFFSKEKKAEAVTAIEKINEQGPVSYRERPITMKTHLYTLSKGEINDFTGLSLTDVHVSGFPKHLSNKEIGDVLCGSLGGKTYVKYDVFRKKDTPVANSTVYFKNREEQQEAISKLNGYPFEGRTLSASPFQYINIEIIHPGKKPIPISGDNRIFIIGLPKDWKEPQIRLMFGGYTILSFKTSEGEKFPIIGLGSDKEVLRAIKEFNQKDLGDRLLYVNRYVPSLADRRYGPYPRRGSPPPGGKKELPKTSPWDLPDSCLIFANVQGITTERIWSVLPGAEECRMMFDITKAGDATQSFVVDYGTVEEADRRYAESSDLFKNLRIVALSVRLLKEQVKILGKTVIMFSDQPNLKFEGVRSAFRSYQCTCFYVCRPPNPELTVGVLVTEGKETIIRNSRGWILSRDRYIVQPIPLVSELGTPMTRGSLVIPEMPPFPTVVPSPPIIPPYQYPRGYPGGVYY